MGEGGTERRTDDDVQGGAINLPGDRCITLRRREDAGNRLADHASEGI
jgi:hypothetical protein